MSLIDSTWYLITSRCHGRHHFCEKIPLEPFPCTTPLAFTAATAEVPWSLSGEHLLGRDMASM